MGISPRSSCYNITRPLPGGARLRVRGFAALVSDRVCHGSAAAPCSNRVLTATGRLRSRRTCHLH